MKKKFSWATILGLAVTVLSQTETNAVTNGVIVITTRTATDALYRQISSSTLYDADDLKGPGSFAPGDAQMAELLQDHGYTTRLVPEWLLRPDAIDLHGVYTDLNPQYFYEGSGGQTYSGTPHADTNYAASLVIVSGSGSSADMPRPNTNGIPILMGEHSCLGNQIFVGHSSIFMYGNKSSGNRTGTTTGPDQYMLVRQPNHPIMQGIPLDAQGRVKIWRDPYPEENAHLPGGTGGAAPKVNWKYSWTAVDLNSSTVAAGTTILGVRAAATNDAVFAVIEADALLADTTALGETDHPWYGLVTAPSRLVHLFVNEHGSGDSRRAFNNLTDIGRVIFVRTCKWAMGEGLTPYVPLNINVSQLNPTSLQLSWNASADKNYKILASANIATPLFNWQTLQQDIPGVNGNIQKTLNIAGVPVAFLKVAAVP